MAESVPRLKAPEVAKQHRISHIMLESDSSLLTNALWSKSRDLSLPEMASLPSVPDFVECFLSGTQ